MFGTRSIRLPFWCAVIILYFTALQHSESKDSPDSFGDKPQCVMYGVCDESPATPGTNLSCVYHGPPKKLKNDSLETLKIICPELVDKYGDELCCSPEQVDVLQTNINLPQAIVGRCPSCFYNFRQSVCNLACGPTQSAYLNISKTIKSSTKPGKKISFCKPC